MGDVLQPLSELGKVLFQIVQLIGTGWTLLYLTIGVAIWIGSGFLKEALKKWKNSEHDKIMQTKAEAEKKLFESYANSATASFENTSTIKETLASIMQILNINISVGKFTVILDSISGVDTSFQAELKRIIFGHIDTLWYDSLMQVKSDIESAFDSKVVQKLNMFLFREDVFLDRVLNYGKTTIQEFLGRYASEITRGNPMAFQPDLARNGGNKSFNDFNEEELTELKRRLNNMVSALVMDITVHLKDMYRDSNAGENVEFLQKERGKQA